MAKAAFPIQVDIRVDLERCGLTHANRVVPSMCDRKPLAGCGQHRASLVWVLQEPPCNLDMSVRYIRGIKWYACTLLEYGGYAFGGV